MLESHRFESPSNTLKRDLFLFASIFGTQTQVGRPIHFLSFCIPLLIILFDQSKIGAFVNRLDPPQCDQIRQF